MWNSDNPSCWNYGIKSLRSYQQSFLLELRDLGLYRVTNNPSFRNYGINTVVELRQSFLLELWDQHTFSSTEFTVSVLNQSSRIIQCYHIHGDQDLQIHFELRFRDDAIHHFHGGKDLQIHFEPRFRDDAIPPHSLGPRPSDTF